VKIAVIAPTYLPARRANTIQVMKMTQAFVELGQAARLAVPGIPDGYPRQKPAWEELASQYGLRQSFPIEWLPVSSWMRRYDFGLRSVRWARNWGAELLYTRLPQAAAIASRSGMETILEVHDLPRGSLGPRLFRWFFTGKGARRLVVITQALADSLIQELGAPVSPSFTVIAPDSVDLERYEELPSPEQARRELLTNPKYLLTSAGGKLSPDRFTAGYTGHLYPGRGADMLLQIAKKLPKILFLIVGGEHDDQARFERQVQSQGLENVLTIGFVPNAELPLFQSACDILLMPYQQHVSASSGGDIALYLSPMKLFEYLASGRAILSSDLAVLREVLNSENAVLLPPGEVDAWVAALKELKDNPEQRAGLAQKARRDAAGYTWQERARRILSGIAPLEKSGADEARFYSNATN